MGGEDMLERRIPDVVVTADLPAPLAAEIDFLGGRPDRWVQSPASGAGVHARALVQFGDLAGARRALGGVRAHDAPLRDVVAAAWAVSRVGDRALAGDLLERLAGHGDGLLVDEVPLGPAGTPVGMLLAGLGRIDEAADRLRVAVDVGDARAPLWGALARLELARVLRCVEAVRAGEDGDAAAGAAARVESGARTFLVAGGYRALLARIDVIQPGELRAAHGLLVAPAPGRRGAPWTVGFGLEASTPVRPAKGLRALAHLVAHRDRVVTAAELAAVVDGVDAEHARRTVAASAVARLDATEPGGRATVGDLLDDATRSRISKLLRRTIERLGDHHVLLAEHLDRTVSTGHVCRYRPGRSVDWQL